MDIQGLIIPLLTSNPNMRSKIQAVFGQPVDHVAKCFSSFMDAVKSGPGVVDQEELRNQRFSKVYNAGLRMGFSDWESELCAADCAGYKVIDVATSFSQRRGWDCSVQEIQNLHDSIMPRFLKRGKEVGLFQDDQPKKASGIPPTSTSKTRGGQPPWRTKGDAQHNAAEPPPKTESAQKEQ